jgi:hypothetical protein
VAQRARDQARQQAAAAEAAEAAAKKAKGTKPGSDSDAAPVPAAAQAKQADVQASPPAGGSK